MSSSQLSSPSHLPLNVTLDQYEQALEKSQDNYQSLLDTLLARDQVQSALKQNDPPSPDQVRQLVLLDDRLRQQTSNQPLSDLANRRQSLHPADSAWWWFLDQIAEERERVKDLPWVLFAGTLMLLTTTLAVVVIKRLWDGVPDLYSIFGTLLTLLLTTSPLFKRGQDLAKLALQRVPFLKPRFRVQAMAGMAWLAFVSVLIGWLLLPQLATWYNNRGSDALQTGDLSTAQRDFLRSTAINPEQVVAYYNLAHVSRRIGRSGEAIMWYQKAIEHDLNFLPAYDGLSQLHNEQSKFELAQKVCLAGLQVLDAPKEEGVAIDTEEKKYLLVTRYGFLCNLGWAYFGQEKSEMAQEILKAAIQLEEELKKLPNGEFRRALPHYYLAQIYEQQSRPKDAEEQWEKAMRLLKRDNLADREWFLVVKKKLNNP